MKKITIILCAVILFSASENSYAQRKSIEKEIVCDKTPDQLPTYKGGDIEAFANDMKKGVAIPAECNEYEINGEVVISFVVTKNGKVKNVKAEKSPFKALSENIQKALTEMRGWTPAMKDGKKVNYRVELKMPFSFIKDKNNVGPMFNGVNSKGFEKFIQKETKIPKEAMAARVEGVVKVEFTVLKSGSPTDFKVITSQSDLLSKDFIELIKKQGKWEPALKDGVAVSDKVTLWTTYKLPQRLDSEPMYRIHDFSYILDHDPMIDLVERATMRGGHDMEFDWYIYKDGRCELRNTFSSSLRMFYTLQTRFENWNWRPGRYGDKDVSVRYHVTIKGGFTHYDTIIMMD